MYWYTNPSWIDHRLLAVKKFEELSPALFDQTNKNLERLLSDNPLVSIVIPAYNEEVNLLSTIHSLSNNETSFGVEIIVVNNNSTDRTQQVLDRLKVRSFFESKQGCGPARQLGQKNAKGKFILMADADCIYPPMWIEKMTRALMEDESVSCVYGRYSFLSTTDKPRWKLFIYESLRDVMAEFRHQRRPCLNALGMSMGYVKDLGLRVGFVNKDLRGEDGRLCLLLKNLGRIKQVRDRSIRVWTLPRTLDKEGSLMNNLLKRIVVECSRMKDYIIRKPTHQVYSTENYNPQAVTYLKKYLKTGKKSSKAV